MKSQVMGIDVGASGAIAGLLASGLGTAWIEDSFDTPAACALFLQMRKHDIAHAFIERTQAMPKWGRTSCFNFGKALGEWIGILATLAIPFTLIEPRKWKAHYNLYGKDKDAGRLRAIQLWPSLATDLARKKDHNRADALLIADYGRTLLK